jgi:peptidoglycan LD-endopeptidase CwlK
MASRAITDLDPVLQPLAQQFLARCAAVGLQAIIIQTYRSAEGQDADYQQGRSAPGPIITNARGGDSPHNCMDANGNPAARGFDFALYAPSGHTLDWVAGDAQWKTAIEIVESLGLISGSTFPGKLCDNDHAELSYWRTNPLPWPLTSDPLQA